MSHECRVELFRKLSRHRSQNSKSSSKYINPFLSAYFLNFVRIFFLLYHFIIDQTLSVSPTLYWTVSHPQTPTYINIYVCECVYLYIYVQYRTAIHTYINTHIHTYMYKYIYYIYMCVRVCVRACVWGWVGGWVGGWVCMCKYVVNRLLSHHFSLTLCQQLRKDTNPQPWDGETKIEPKNCLVLIQVLFLRL